VDQRTGGVVDLTGDVRVHYQPQCDAVTGAVVGLEALARRHDRLRGLLRPDEFLSLLGPVGLDELTEVVLTKAIHDVSRWQVSDVAPRMSVNVHGEQFTMGLVARIAGLLERHDLPPERLTVELTEASYLAEDAAAITACRALHSLGIELSMDDFGTGWSSLSQLKALHPDELKIDKVFVANLADSSDDAVIVHSTIRLAHDLGMRVVAEGVEDLATWHLLRGLGCDAIQGHLVAPPLPAELTLDWLNRTRRFRADLAGRAWAVPPPLRVLPEGGEPYAGVAGSL
jgi:EAL domain-containing protein (putative c-di-GMP-specific phosphodiesterase class I)